MSFMTKNNSKQCERTLNEIHRSNEIDSIRNQCDNYINCK